jgi:hypothetical protein
MTANAIVAALAAARAPSGMTLLAVASGCLAAAVIVASR